MRHVPVFQSGKTPDEQWLTRAGELTRKLVEAPDAIARAKLIQANQKHWKQLLAWLLDISKGKCWYSEARDLVQYWEVEHFRPKAAVKKSVGACNQHGYWWLAFDWENYRIAGQVINRKKSSFFPLREGTFVADAPGKSHKDETPYFLDPTDENDCELVFFDELGQFVPKPGADEWESERVRVTQERFNLNCESLRQYRKALWQECRALMAEYMNLMRQHRTEKSVTRKAEAKRVLQQLRSMVRFDQPFSSVVITCLVAANEPSLARAVLTAS